MLDNGADFDELIAEYSADAAGSEMYPEGYTVIPNSVSHVKEFVEAAKFPFVSSNVDMSKDDLLKGLFSDVIASKPEEGKIYNGLEMPGLEILDRVGGGDSFASGLVYGLMEFGDPQTAVNYGVAHGALAMTTPGDTSMASLKEVENIVKGSGARVQR